MTDEALMKLKKRIGRLKEEVIELKVRNFGTHAKIVSRAIAVAERLYVEVRRNSHAVARSSVTGIHRSRNRTVTRVKDSVPLQA